MANNKRLLWNGHFRSLGRIGTGLVGRKIVVRSISGEDIGHTKGAKNGTATICVNPTHKCVPAEQVGAVRFVDGVFTHEMGHQLFTDFVAVENFETMLKHASNYPLMKFCNDAGVEVIELNKGLSENELSVFHDIWNRVEDTSIEYWIFKTIGGELPKALRYTIATTYKSSPNIDEMKTSFTQVITAMTQYGDVGLLKGNFTFSEAREHFLKIQPIYDSAIEEPNAKKRLCIAYQIFDELRPLWESALQNEELMQQLLKELLKAMENSHNDQTDENGNMGKGTYSSNANRAGHNNEDDDENNRNNKNRQRKQKTIEMTKKEFEKLMNQLSKNDSDGSDGDNNKDVINISVKDDTPLNNSNSKKPKDSGDNNSPANSENDNSEDGNNEPSDNRATSNSNGIPDEEQGDDEENSSNSGTSSNDGKDQDSQDGKSGLGSSSQSSKKESDDKQGNGTGAGLTEPDEEDETNDQSSGNGGSNDESDTDAQSQSGSFGDKSDDNSNDGSDGDGTSDGGDNNSNSSNSANNTLSEGSETENNNDPDLPYNVIDEDDIDLSGDYEDVWEEAEISDEDADIINERIDNEIQSEKLFEIRETNEDGITDFNDISGRGFTKANCKNIIVNGTEYLRYGYDLIVEQMRPDINKLASQLKRATKRPNTIKVKKSTGALNVDRYSRINACQTTKLFDKRRTPDKNDIAVFVNVDESGSMAGSKTSTARMVCIALTEACAIAKIPIYIMGFTADVGSYDAYHLHYVRWKNTLHERWSLMNISSRTCNFDGYSIRYATRLLQKRPENSKLLIVVSDGQPVTRMYGGGFSSIGVADTKEAVRQATVDGIVVHGIAIAGRDNAVLKEIYGSNFTDNNNLQMLFRDFSRAILKQLQKEW